MVMKSLARVIMGIWLIAPGTARAQTQKPDAVGSSGAVPDSSGSVAATGGGHLPMLQRRNQRYQLHSADVLELSFPFTPEFNQTVTVQPDGYITLRGLSDFHVAVQTKPELTRALQTAFAKILHEPVITVDLKDFEKPYFIAGGEVARPGKYELRGDTTVTQAVAIAGGFKDSAKHSQVLLFRRISDDWAAAKILNVKKMLRGGNLQEDSHLQPGDMLFVPKNAISKIKPFIPIPGIGAYFNPAP